MGEVGGALGQMYTQMSRSINSLIGSFQEWFLQTLTSPLRNTKQAAEQVDDDKKLDYV